METEKENSSIASYSKISPKTKRSKKSVNFKSELDNGLLLGISSPSDAFANDSKCYIKTGVKNDEFNNFSEYGTHIK